MKQSILVWALAAQTMLPAANQFYQRNLVADLPGVADQVDPLLKNPWGICTSAASPFWTSNQGSGTSTVYNSFGVPNATLKPVIPATAGSNAPGKPTGCVNNSTATAFFVPNSAGRTAAFLFATENGSISGWANAVNPAQAIVMIDNSQSGANYKGLAIATPSAEIGPRIYAANFGNRRVDVYDKNWQPVYFPGAFNDLDLPSGFAPFNVEVLGGKVYVTFAKQDADKEDDVPGPGNGYVDVFDFDGVLISRLIAGGNLNSPWGLAIAPAAFGELAGTLLVGNFGDGHINAYNATTGAWVAALQDKDGNPIHIPGLWALRVGNGGNGGNVNTVYFSSGPDAEQHGLLGSLQPAPAVKENSVLNTASYVGTIASGGFGSVFGTNLAATQRTWANKDIVDGKLPTSLDGVSVTVGGKPAYIYFISPGQINLIVPTGLTPGSIPVVVTNNALTAASAQATLTAFSPAFFISRLNNAIATHANGTLVGATTLYPNNSTPAKQGETIELWMTGLGPTDPATDGVVVPAPIPTTLPLPTVTIGGVAATVTSSVLASPGLYQVNVTVGQTTPSGDQLIVLSIGGVQSQAGTVLAVQ